MLKEHGKVLLCVHTVVVLCWCKELYQGMDPLVHAQLFFVFQFRAMFEVFILLTRIQSSLLFLLRFSWFLEMF